MTIRWIAVLILGFSQSVSAFGFHSPKPEQPYSPIVKKEQVGTYSLVDVQGQTDLLLRTGFKQPQVIMKGDPRDLKYTDIHVNEGKLTLRVAKGYPKFGPLHAELRTRYLNGLEYLGKGHISGPKLKANLVHLTIDNEGKTSLKGVVRLGQLTLCGKSYTEISGATSPMLHVKLSDHAQLKLSGDVRLRTIDLAGNSWLSTRWVKSTSLWVRLKDHAYAQLAGIANKLDAKASDEAHFNGRYLRVRRGYVKTEGKAIADVSITKHQHTLATDESDIRFYNLPDFKTNFMAFDGSVLDMRALSSPLVEEPTSYNKGVAQG